MLYGAELNAKALISTVVDKYSIHGLPMLNAKALISTVVDYIHGSIAYLSMPRL